MFFINTLFLSNTPIFDNIQSYLDAYFDEHIIMNEICELSYCKEGVGTFTESKKNVSLGATLVVQLPLFSPVDNQKDFHEITLQSDVNIKGTRYKLVGIVYHIGYY